MRMVVSPVATTDDSGAAIAAARYRAGRARAVTTHFGWRPLFYGRPVSADAQDAEPDLALELELRDELLVACRQLLLKIGTREAAALVAHIDVLLDLDDDASPGSRP
jgi:hypothetical protein